MNKRQTDRPLIAMEVVEPDDQVAEKASRADSGFIDARHPRRAAYDERRAAHDERRTAHGERPVNRQAAAARYMDGLPPLLRIETLDDASLVTPEPETDAALLDGPASSVPDAPRGGWFGWCILAGVAGITVIGATDWVLGLLERVPLLGVPAAVAAAALMLGGVGVLAREVLALRRLHDVEHVRTHWATADGEQLRRLILRVGRELGTDADARRAADVVDDTGPEAARRIMSRDVLSHRDRQASAAVVAAARQGFVMVTASPSPFLDSLLLMARAARLLRQVAVIYGYRPGALTLRSLAIAAARDAGAVAIAHALAQAAAESASHSVEKAGDAVTMAGLGVSASGVGALVGLPLAGLGLAMSLGGRALGPAGGAVGGGAAAAWRLYRFGLMVLVAARPVPFDVSELDALTSRTRSDVLRFRATDMRAEDQGIRADRGTAGQADHGSA